MPLHVTFHASVVLAIASLFLGCAHSKAAPAATPAPASPPSAASATASAPPAFELPPPTSIDWVTSAAEARARAADESKPLLVFVRSARSPAAVAMDQTVWKDARVLRQVPRFVALRIDVTDPNDASAEELTRALAIETVPTTLIVNTEGRVVGRFAAGAARAADVAEAMRQAH